MGYKRGAVAPKRAWGPFIFISKFNTAGAREIWIWPISIQRTGKNCPDVKLTSQERRWNQASFLSGNGNKICTKRDLKNHIRLSKIWKIFCLQAVNFGARNGPHGTSLVVCRVSSGRPIVVLFWTKYSFPRQIKPRILKLTIIKGHSNLLTVFSFVNCEEKGYYRVVSVGHLQSSTKVLGTPGSDNWNMRWQAILETITNGITGIRNPLPPWQCWKRAMTTSSR